MPQTVQSGVPPKLARENPDNVLFLKYPQAERSQPSPERNRRVKVRTKISGVRQFSRFRIGLLASLLIAIFGMGGLLLSTFRDHGISVGSTSVRLDFEKGGTLDAWFEHNQWDGPTGEFTRGRELAMRIPGGVFQIRIEQNPMEAIRRRLPEAIPGLIEYLDSKNPAEVYAAAQALASKKGAAIAALPKLLALAEKNRDTASAIDDISSAAPQESFPLLGLALASTNKVFRSYIAATCAQLGTNAASLAPALLQAFRTTPREHQADIALAIWRVSHDCHEILPTLQTILREETNRHLQWGAMHVLGEVGACAEPAVPDLLRLLESAPDPSLPNQAVQALVKIGRKPEWVVPKLAEAASGQISSSWAATRTTAILALGKFIPEGLPHLVSIYQGTNAQDRVAAGRAFMEAGPQAADFLHVFISQLQSTNVSRVTAACEIIGTLGARGEPAVPHLEAQLYSKNNRVRARAANALAQLGRGTGMAVQVLIEVVGGANLGDSLYTRSSEEERALGALDKILSANPELRPLYKRELKSNRSAWYYIELRRTLSKRYDLPVYTNRFTLTLE